MAQARTISHAENKRSLPAWMMSARSVNEAPKTEDQNKEALESNVKIAAVDLTTPIQRNMGRRLTNVNSEGATEPVVLQRCEGKENARRKSKGAVKDEVKGISDVANKKGRKASEAAAVKNNRKRKLENIKSETSSPVSIDDDIELTVEDLVSIAEEYVNADKQKQHDLEDTKITRQKEKFLCPTVADTGVVSAANAPPIKGLLQCTIATRNTTSSEHGGDENKNHQELQCLSSYKTTEDVAQDMLSLFLGPLWNKPAGYAKKSEPVESITRATNNHVRKETDLHSEVPMQGEWESLRKSLPVRSMTTTVNPVPEKKDWRSELPNLGEPVITKKKSSLRDKVALFL